MSDQKLSWASLIADMPEVRSVVTLDDPRVADYVARISREDESPAQLLTAIEARAAGSERAAIEAAYAKNAERRVRKAKPSGTGTSGDSVPTWQVLLAIALAVIGPLAAFPRARGGGGFVFELGMDAFFAGLLSVVGVAVNYAVERQSRRMLPFPSWFHIGYAVWAGAAVVFTSQRVLGDGEQLTGAAAVGSLLSILAVVGYLLVYRRALAHSSGGGSRTARASVESDTDYFARLDDLDDDLRRTVDGILSRAGDLDRDAVRAATVRGVQRLYGRDVIDEDEAEWMLSEAMR